MQVRQVDLSVVIHVTRNLQKGKKKIDNIYRFVKISVLVLQIQFRCLRIFLEFMTSFQNRTKTEEIGYKFSTKQYLPERNFG